MASMTRHESRNQPAGAIADGIDGDVRPRSCGSTTRPPITPWLSGRPDRPANPCHQELSTPVTLLLLKSILCDSAAPSLGGSTSVPPCTSQRKSLDRSADRPDPCEREPRHGGYNLLTAIPCGVLLSHDVLPPRSRVGLQTCGSKLLGGISVKFSQTAIDPRVHFMIALELILASLY